MKYARFVWPLIWPFLFFIFFLEKDYAIEIQGSYVYNDVSILILCILASVSWNYYT